MNIAIIGHSHISCINRAYRAGHYPFSLNKFGIENKYKKQDHSQAIKSFVKDTKADHILLLLSTNEFSKSAAVKQQSPFTFQCKQAIPDHFPVIKNGGMADWLRRSFLKLTRLPYGLMQKPVKQLPYEVVLDSMRKRMNHMIHEYRTYTDAIKTGGSGTTIHMLLPPPPVLDTDYKFERRTYKNAWYKGYADPDFRLKLYYLSLQVHREIAKELDLPIIPNRSFAVDDYGLLKPCYYGLDQIHANTYYGESYLHYIMKELESHNAPLQR